MITVTKKFRFCYSHYLPGYDGKCVHLHGHNAVLEVEVKGPPTGTDSYNGMVCDFHTLKEVVESKIIDIFDHGHMNDHLEIPTAENMALLFRDLLQPIFGSNLVRIRVYETLDSFAEWKNIQ